MQTNRRLRNSSRSAASSKSCLQDLELAAERDEFLSLRFVCITRRDRWHRTGLCPLQGDHHRIGAGREPNLLPGNHEICPSLGEAFGPNYRKGKAVPLLRIT